MRTNRQSLLPARGEKVAAGRMRGIQLHPHPALRATLSRTRERAL
jgi:hypothetical protein